MSKLDENRPTVYMYGLSMQEWVRAWRGVGYGRVCVLVSMYTRSGGWWALALFSRALLMHRRTLSQRGIGAVKEAGRIMAQCDLFLESSGCPYPSIPIPTRSRERAVGHGVLQPGTPGHIHSGFSGTGPDGGLDWTRTRIAPPPPSPGGPQASPRLAGCARTRELFVLEHDRTG